MSKPPPSWRLKIDRAQHHLKEVESKVTAYKDTHSYRAVKGKDLKREQHVWRYELAVADQPDPMLAIVVGDVVHNVRSALDHIAVALVPKNRRRKASFPIRLEDPHRRDASGQLVDEKGLASFEAAIDGASVKAKAIIERFQPYHAAEPFFDSLGVISRLDNADKHRDLAVLMQGITDAKVTIRIRGTDRTRHITQPDPGLREHGAVLTKFNLAGWRGKPLKESEMKVEVRGTVVVAVRIGSDEESRKATGNIGGVRLPGALGRAVTEIADVLDALEPEVRP